MTRNGSDAYRVDWSLAMPSLRKLPQRATEQSPTARLRLANALKAISAALQQSPLEWGEPSYNLKTLTISVGFNERFCVSYGVNANARIVFVRSLSDMTE